MDIIARFPRLPAEAIEGARQTEEQATSPDLARKVSRRLAGGKSRRFAVFQIVAVGRGGPMLLERLPTRSPTPCVTGRFGGNAREISARQPVFPGLSVVVLAVVAVAVWSLAAWNDTLRLARQQRPERLAARPVSTQPASP